MTPKERFAEVLEIARFDDAAVGLMRTLPAVDARPWPQRRWTPTTKPPSRARADPGPNVAGRATSRAFKRAPARCLRADDQQRLFRDLEEPARAQGHGEVFDSRGPPLVLLRGRLRG